VLTDGGLEFKCPMSKDAHRKSSEKTSNEIIFRFFHTLDFFLKYLDFALSWTTSGNLVVVNIHDSSC
jgi:hypothetical protein